VGGREVANIRLPRAGLKIPKKKSLGALIGFSYHKTVLVESVRKSAWAVLIWNDNYIWSEILLDSLSRRSLEAASTFQLHLLGTILQLVEFRENKKKKITLEVTCHLNNMQLTLWTEVLVLMINNYDDLSILKQ